MKSLTLCMLLVLTASASADNKPIVYLKVNWSQERWDGYPDSVDKPSIVWSGNTLHVRDIIDWDSDWTFSENNATGSLTGSTILLCYFTRPVERKYKKGEPIMGGATAPAILEFTVTGIPVGTYTVKVSRDCK